MKRWIGAALCLLLICGSSVGCTDKDNNASAPSEVSSSLPSSSAPASESDVSDLTPAGTMNPLTGEYNLNPAAKGRRPVAVMISNITQALPQHGIASADICYETIVEGGITRIMATYADYESLPITGSIRSARPVFVQLAQGQDAIFTHVGGSDEALSYIKQKKIDDIEGLSDNTTIWRDPERKTSLGSLHSCVTDGAHLKATIEMRKLRTDVAEGANLFRFRSPDDPQKPAGSDCVKATVPFSNYCVAVFDYDAQTDLYKKSQFGSAQVDALGGQVAVTNVLVLYTTMTNTGDGAGHVNVALEGGKGIFISHGGQVAIKWSKGDAASPLKLSTMDEATLSLNAGRTWVCFVAQGTDVQIQ